MAQTPNIRSDTPADIPTSGWKRILGRVWVEAGEDHLLLIAAGVTFYALLAIVPALTAIVSLYGLFADPGGLADRLNVAHGLLPEGAIDILREQLQRLSQQGGATLGFASLISLSVALWSANAGTKALVEAMNVAYDATETRSYIHLTLVTLGATIGAIVVILLTLGLAVVLPPILAAFRVPTGTQWLVRLGGLGIGMLLMVLGLAVLYRYGACRSHARWKWITPGAALAVPVVVVASALFSWFVAAFGSYSAAYGSLGAIFGFMTWLWIAASIVVLGAKLNAETELEAKAGALPRHASQRYAAATPAALDWKYGPGPDPRKTDLALGRLAMALGAAWLSWRARGAAAQAGKRRR